MDGLEFIKVPLDEPVDPVRADIACFVGLVSHRASGVGVERELLTLQLNEIGWSGPKLPGGENDPLIPADVLPAGDSNRAFGSWLRALGWASDNRPSIARRSVNEAFEGLLEKRLDETIGRWLKERGYLDPTASYTALELLELRDVPVPIASWDAFDKLFAWDERPIDDLGSIISTDLGAAVRSFFRQGGRKCFVVSVGEPFLPQTPSSLRLPVQSRLLPLLLPSPLERSSWRGAGHLYGLPEVSMLCLPDLPAIFATDSMPFLDYLPPVSEEKFIECKPRVNPSGLAGRRQLRAARCDSGGMGLWQDFVSRVGEWISDKSYRGGQVLRETQFIAAVPLPVSGSVSSSDAGTNGLSASLQWEEAAKIKTAFVQLAYPWLRTLQSEQLPEGLEAPDGTLAGLLANQALTAGAWKSAAFETVPGLLGVQPVLSRDELESELPLDTDSMDGPSTVRERISIFGPSPMGMKLLSDVTASANPSWRPANLCRLMNVVRRTARLAGEQFAFAKNDERLWERLKEALTGRLADLWSAGALDGETAAEAFEVRCDRSTMTDGDLDGGRVIVRVGFTAAYPINRIIAVLAMTQGSQLRLVAADTKAEAA
jgi:hypothetical protein